MRAPRHKGFAGVLGQCELISPGAIIAAGANATNSLKASIYLTQNWKGPSDSVGEQQREQAMGQCEQTACIRWRAKWANAGAPAEGFSGH